MKKIDETFMHFLWKNQQLAGLQLISDDGESIKVEDPGLHNPDAGPDFFNARIQIGNTRWAGNIELHINASDWISHGHSNDPAYDSVILHVVYFNDCRIRRSDGQLIPSAILRFPHLMWDHYRQLMETRLWIPCQEKIVRLPSIIKTQWTGSVMIEKLMSRTAMIQRHLDDLQGNWDATLIRLLFRSFGLPVNTTPFEMLALLTPYTILLRNRNSLFTLEAILFGQAGMLDTTLPPDKYAESLRLEFIRLRGRLPEPTVPPFTWKYMRMRPTSFPSIRIAQLAALIHRHWPLHKQIEKKPSISELTNLLRVKAGDYWDNHYQFGKLSNRNNAKPGKEFAFSLIINCIVPYAFTYGKLKGIKGFTDYAMELLEQLPPEKNHITRKWDALGINILNAFESQALIYLYKNYCQQKKCLACQFGNYFILNNTTGRTGQTPIL